MCVCVRAGVRGGAGGAAEGHSRRVRTCARARARARAAIARAGLRAALAMPAAARVPVLSAEAALERLAANAAQGKARVHALYASPLGGIVKDPALMMLPLTDHSASGGVRPRAPPRACATARADRGVLARNTLPARYAQWSTAATAFSTLPRSLAAGSIACACTLSACCARRKSPRYRTPSMRRVYAR